MENEYRTLSQEELDAILAGKKLDRFDSSMPDDDLGIRPSNPAEPPPKVINVTEARMARRLASEASNPVPPPVTPQPVTPRPVELPPTALGIQSDIAGRLERLEQAASEITSAVEQIRREFAGVSQALNLLSQRLEGVVGGLKSTPAYRVRETFTCAQCEAKGNIATPIKCTECGKVNWFGWWPKPTSE